jgi:hypothetical protein
MLMTRSRSRLRILLPTCCLLVAGCSSSPNDQPPVADAKVPVGDNGLPKVDDGVPAKECDCKDTEVCDSNKQCVAKPVPAPTDVLGYVVLENYVDPTFATMPVTGGAVGRFEATFYVKEDPPWADPRTQFTTPEGDVCYRDEFSCSYPHCHNDEVWLPKGLGAGDLTFTIAGAPGPVVLTPFNAGGASGDDWMYDINPTNPGPLKEGTTTYGSWFDKKYLPLGATFDMAATGGPQLKAETFAGLQMPTAFEIQSPPSNHPVSTTEDLHISWTPAQTGATMSLELVSGETAALRCNVRDDGSVTIPTAALASLGGVNYITFQRTVTRYWKTTTVDGRTAHLYLSGRSGIGYRIQ